MDSQQNSLDTFRVREGAVVDLLGLQAISNLPHHLLTSYLYSISPGSSALILHGLEPEGQRPKSSGPPGIMRFAIDRISLSPGVAILPDQEGRLVVVRFENSQDILTTEQQSAKHLRSLVLSLHMEEGQTTDLQPRAASVVTPKFQVIPTIELEESDDSLSFLPVAHELGKKIWTTDICRLWQPAHPAILMIFQMFDNLEDVIWNSDPSGDPWDLQSLGREWKTYQTKASVSVTSARMTLAGRASTTQDRVRLLQNLHWQLQRSVTKAATTLSKWMGIPKTAGQYAPVFSVYPEEWDEMF